MFAFFSLGLQELVILAILFGLLAVPAAVVLFLVLGSKKGKDE